VPPLSLGALSSSVGPRLAAGTGRGVCMLSQLARSRRKARGRHNCSMNQITWVPDFWILNTSFFLLSHAQMRGNGPAFDRSTAAPYRTPLVALFGSGCCKGASRTYLVLQTTTHFPSPSSVMSRLGVFLPRPPRSKSLGSYKSGILLSPFALHAACTRPLQEHSPMKICQAAGIGRRKREATMGFAVAVVGGARVL